MSLGVTAIFKCIYAGVNYFVTTTVVVGPPPANGRNVFVVFLSFCTGFYSILSLSRCAYGPFFKLVFSFLMLRCELSS